MYCHQCGKEIPDQAKYCTHCGTAQNFSEPPRKSGTGGNGSVRILLIIAAVVSVVCAGIALVATIGSRQPAAQKVEQNTVQVEATVPPATLWVPETTEAEPIQTPDNGWYEMDGEVYYYADGMMLTGMQEIDDDLYYFYEDGTMAVNTDVDINGNTLEAGSDGRVTGVVFESISGEWASEKYNFGNNGRSSILELEIDVENCDKMTLYVEAEGQYGANVSGKWKFYVRRNGAWEYVQDFDYSEPSGYFTIRFDRPMDFDAITAYPTKQGNASYATYYCLFDVHMGL